MLIFYARANFTLILELDMEPCPLDWNHINIYLLLSMSDSITEVIYYILMIIIDGVDFRFIVAPPFYD